MCAALVLAAVSVVAVTPVEIGGPALRAAIETSAALAALAAVSTYAVVARSTARRSDLLRFAAVVVLATMEVIAYAGPAAFNVRPGFLWAAPALMAIPAGIALVAASLRPAAVPPAIRALAAGLARAGARPGRDLVLDMGARALLAALAAAAIAWLGRGVLGSAQYHPALEVAVFGPGAALLLAVALRRLQTPPDAASGPDRWAAAGLALLGLALIDRRIDPGGGLSASDVLRLAGLVLLAAAGARRLGRMRRAELANVAAAERRRLAGDLHDGICQDLAFISAYGAQLEGTYGEEHPIVIASRRALAASRGALADLSARDAADIDQALALVAADLGRRFGFAVAIEVDPDVPVLAPTDRDDLVRIAREALVNAAVHGRARRVTVSLARQDGHCVLRVTDDGTGLPSGTASTDGFGTQIMRERADRLGASLDRHPGDLGGAEIEVVLPS